LDGPVDEVRHAARAISAEEAMSQIYDVPMDLIRFKYRLAHLAKALAGSKVTIVAIGSSSTRGAGSSKSEEWSYPARLAIELNARYPDVSIEVQNHGFDGQEAGDELARFKNAFALRPHLIVWQVGTNAIVKSYDLDEVEFAIERGLTRLQGGKFDVIVMDP
jgi:acyl-CoA thioesterase-1